MNLETYENYINKTIQSYKTVRFCDFFENSKIKLKYQNSKDKFCLLRHDIDFDLQNALNIAKIEAKKKVFSTFTILLGSEYYNPFEKENRKIISKILKLGHEIGLHFDVSLYKISNEKELEFYLKIEKSILENLINSKIVMFSFHNTNNFTMKCRNESYANLINSYSNNIQLNIDYVSDSNGYWRFRSWDEILKNKKKFIQILTHPVWWNKNNELKPFETVCNTILKRSRKNILNYCNNFSLNSERKNISSLNKYLIEKYSNPNDHLFNYLIKTDIFKELFKDNPKIKSVINTIKKSLGN